MLAPEPWLPRWVMCWRVRKAWIERTAGFADKRLRWSERLARPRLRFLAQGFGERITALINGEIQIAQYIPPHMAKRVEGSIKKAYGKKGEEIVKMNFAAVMCPESSQTSSGKRVRSCTFE